MTPKILSLFYNASDGAIVVVEGYPNLAIEAAREMLTMIFEPYGRWHMTKIECSAPGTRGKALDSEWLVSVEAALKLPR